MVPKRVKNDTLEKIYKEQGSCCYYCKTETNFVDITRDHVLPKRDGHGLKDNSVFACRKCNHHKGCKTLEEFLEYTIAKLVEILAKVKEQDFKIKKLQLKSFRKHHQVMLTLSTLIKNNGKPEYR